MVRHHHMSRFVHRNRTEKVDGEQEIAEQPESTFRDITVGIVSSLATALLLYLTSLIRPEAIVHLVGGATESDLAEMEALSIERYGQIESNIEQMKVRFAEKDSRIESDIGQLDSNLKAWANALDDVRKQINLLAESNAEDVIASLEAIVEDLQSQLGEFAVRHLTDRTGEAITELVTADEEPALDNSSGEAPLQILIQFERNYRYMINERITSDKVSGQAVRDKIVELYKMPPSDPEGMVQTAHCPISVVIPAGKKAKIAVEWTEVWADGVINEGIQGNGERPADYSVFLGYLEPCSLVDQQFVD